ncbi:uncharacterized protein [Rutidosis leptorrhynchoides]|uniref:uncharacterized protein n=1 Tax=Rutidosis leptorrhynchoides TaxID=125765 RepID=UPI003A99D6F6
MQVYWCLVFILPDMIIEDIEKILRVSRRFEEGKAKVRWDDLCMPKLEGGLGIKRLKYWNVALMTSHIWSIITNKQTLWVQWIHAYRLSDRHFWDVPIPANTTWFDTWSSSDPIADTVSRRDIASLGFHPNTKVADLAQYTRWTDWWIQKYPLMADVSVSLYDAGDVMRWKKDDSSLHVFSVNQSFEDSHSHLFFDCVFSSKVWESALRMIRFPINSNKWQVIAASLGLYASRNVSSIIVAKLVFAAFIYFIWQERNNHIFKKSHRTEVKLFEDIYCTVRLKLLSIRFKSSKGVEYMKSIWHM